VSLIKPKNLKIMTEKQKLTGKRPNCICCNSSDVSIRASSRKQNYRKWDCNSCLKQWIETFDLRGDLEKRIPPKHKNSTIPPLNPSATVGYKRSAKQRILSAFNVKESQTISDLKNHFDRKESFETEFNAMIDLGEIICVDTNFPKKYSLNPCLRAIDRAS
jgi:hypothetical protein